MVPSDPGPGYPESLIEACDRAGRVELYTMLLAGLCAALFV